jgi:hypothetical protein
MRAWSRSLSASTEHVQQWKKDRAEVLDEFFLGGANSQRE